MSRDTTVIECLDLAPFKFVLFASNLHHLVINGIFLDFLINFNNNEHGRPCLDDLIDFDAVKSGVNLLEAKRTNTNSAKSKH